MLTVKNNWKDVRVGDRIHFVAQYGKDGYKATVVDKGTQNSEDHVYGVYFADNVTLKLDGSPRKSSAKERRNVSLYAYFWFDIIDSDKPEVSIPKTAGELTDEHIGMKFRFHGTPEIDGTYEGKIRSTGPICVAEVTYDSWAGRGDYPLDAEKWSGPNGYWIDGKRNLTYLGGSPKQVDETVDTDAKLAAYFNQELDRVMKSKLGSHGTHDYGEHIVEILKTLTK